MLNGEGCSLEKVKKRAHDLKGPVSALKFAAYLLQGVEAKDSANQSTVLSVVSLLDAAKDSLTAIANSELGVKNAETVESAVRNAVLMCNARNSGNLIKVNAEGELNLPAVAGLTSVLVNLLDNAIEASNPGSSVELRVQSGSKISIQVIDHGAGISTEVLKRIESGECVTTKWFGNGVGLRSVYEWAAKNKCKLEVVTGEDDGDFGTMVGIEI